MFKDLFIRVAVERLAAQTPLLHRFDAGPELYISAEKLKEITAQSRRQIAARLADFPGHTLHAPFMDVWPGAADDDIRRLSLEQMRRVMDLASTWKSLLVVMHFNFDPIYYSHHVPQWLDRAAAFYRELLRENDGPLIALENIAEPTPHIVLQLMKKIAHPRLVHCFDFGHHHVFARIPLEEWLFYLAPQRHIHFHLHDNFGCSDDHLAMGQGHIDWPAAKAALCGLDCPFSIALEPKSPDNLKASATYFKKNFL
ncbi:MAG TPA: sugar phosphate isomerase/epimerase family protein [Candidatus Binatia bacterium]|nr:sugar phosphate isomerase/epimerase family protein [Candidatus Binatia bacterium]